MSVAATIVFCDIVNFSGFPSYLQKDLIVSLTNEVRSNLGTLITEIQGTPGVIALPTGDGMALVFIHDANPKWDHTNIFDLLYKLHKWAFDITTPIKNVELRIGVHAGPVELVTDINQRQNICGETINYAQRVMDSANGRQVIFSDEAFQRYIGHTMPRYNYSSDCVAVFQGPIDVQAKHNMRMLVYKMTLEPPAHWWSNNDPISKNQMVVNLTPLPKEIIGSFSENIAAAKNVALIQLTGSRMLEALKSGDVKLSSKIERFMVFMPDPEVYRNMDLPADYSVPNAVSEYIQEWKNYLHSIKNNYKYAIFKLGLFRQPPYFGASFIDWYKQGGKIHVSPYVWGLPTEQCPGYELGWVGSQASSVYQAYVAGLDALNARTSNEL